MNMAGQGISLPSGAGGLMRYNDEYQSNIMLKPAHVVLFLIIITVATLALKLFF